jgi:hypothetical protein
MKFMVFLLLLNLGCSSEKAGDSLSSSGCTNVSDTLSDPNSIEDTINLINALPRPLTIDCFLTSLKAPLKVFAVNNAFSAQPAVDQQSPRIFILKNTFVLSVVPAGVGRNLLEFAELDGTLDSFKGEVEFPVEGTVTVDQIVSHISQTTSTSTCVTCHGSERKSPYKSLGNLFVSRFIRPNESQRVQYPYLRAQATACNPAINKLRCDILNAIYTKGQAEDGPFPY